MLASEHPLPRTVRSHIFADGGADAEPSFQAFRATFMSNVDQVPLVVGISGASGVVYGLRTLDACRELGVATHLVVSRSAVLTLAQETGLALGDVQAKATVAHRTADVGASIASGSFRT